MKIAIIVAMASNRVIGLNKKIPWHLSADLKHFKAITLNHPVLMGRKTYESIGKPLPNRHNIIISRNSNYVAKGCIVVSCVAQAIATCQQYDEVFIIGGAAFYEAMLPKADVLYLTQINKKFTGDTFFPIIAQKEWQEVAREDITTDTNVDFSYSFITLTRKPIKNHPQK